MYESTFTCVCTKTYCSLWPFVCTRPSSLTFAKFVNNIKCCAHMDWRVAYGAILCFFPFLLFFYFTFCVTTTTEILMWWLLSWSKLTRKKRLIFVNSFHNVYMPPYVYTWNIIESITSLWGILLNRIKKHNRKGRKPLEENYVK